MNCSAIERNCARSARTTLAPWALNCFAVAAPMPRAAPVIRTVLLVAVERMDGSIVMLDIVGLFGDWA